jgi:uncharacterized protein YwgA
MLKLINKILIYFKKKKQLAELELDGKFFETYSPFVEIMKENIVEIRNRLGKLNEKQKKAGRLLDNNDAREKQELEGKINFFNSIAEKMTQVKKFQDEVKAYIASIWS